MRIFIICLCFMVCTTDCGRVYKPCRLTPETFISNNCIGMKNTLSLDGNHYLPLPDALFFFEKYPEVPYPQSSITWIPPYDTKNVINTRSINNATIVGEIDIYPEVSSLLMRLDYCSGIHYYLVNIVHNKIVSSVYASCLEYSPEAGYLHYYTVRESKDVFSLLVNSTLIQSSSDVLSNSTKTAVHYSPSTTFSYYPKNAERCVRYMVKPNGRIKIID